MNQPGSPPPNWYPDPRGEAELRYWDGSQWTEHTHSGAAAAAPAAPPPAQAPPPQAAPPSAPPPQAAPPAGPAYGTATDPTGSKSGNRTGLIAVVGLVAVLAVALGILLIAGSGGDDGGGEEGKVEDVIKEAITGKDPSGCRELITTAFIQKSTHETGSAAISECEASRAQSTVSDVDITDVKVDGDRATATATPRDGPAKDRELELTLVKAGGDWKIDDLDQPAQAEPDRAERSVITTVLNFGSSEGDKACDYLSFKKLQELGGTEGCTKAFKDATAANYLAQDTTVTGRTATITVRETKGNSTIKFQLSRELGTWRIDDYEKQT